MHGRFAALDRLRDGSPREFSRRSYWSGWCPFAGWLAWSAVREQIDDERGRETELKRQKIDRRLTQMDYELRGMDNYIEHANDVLAEFDEALRTIPESTRWRLSRAVRHVHMVGRLQLSLGFIPAELGPRIQLIFQSLMSMAGHDQRSSAAV